MYSFVPKKKYAEELSDTDVSDEPEEDNDNSDEELIQQVNANEKVDNQIASIT